ncbi:MAG: peptidyl-dipeptidase A [Rhodothermales bacterium]|jgi:peptidyl-dipeptidase A
MGRIVAIFVLVASLVPIATTPAAAQNLERAALTAEGAEAFITRVEEDLEDLGLKLLRAKWVQWTYITHDTEQILADASDAYAASAIRFVQESARFDSVELPTELRRKFDILRSLLVTPAPADPALMAEVSRLYTDLTSLAAKPEYCQPDGTCFEIEELNRIMSTSQDVDSLRLAWQAGRLATPPMRDKYTRFAALMNQGAEELGFADLGEMWRSTYDLDPDVFIEELDRVWDQVRPLYEALHCYVGDKLQARYGQDVVRSGEPIPAHLLGSMSGSGWANLFDSVAPENADPGYDLTAILLEEGVDEQGMARYAERFFVSLGLDPLPDTFWERSMFKKPADRDVVCGASAWDLDDKDDVRIKMCISITGRSLETVHHEVGHNIYQRAYQNQPTLFRASANYGFHEALGSTMALSLTPRYLVRVGLLDREPENASQLGVLLRSALGKVTSVPNGLMIDRWRWKVFSGEIGPDDYNQGWWDLREEYQGITPPVERPEHLFDPGTRRHIPTNVPYTRYFVSQIVQFQFHKALCEVAGEDVPLHLCSIYGSEAAGERLQQMMELGRELPWPDALEVLTGQRDMDASAMLEYYEPLREWLDEENRGRVCGW